MNEENHNGTAVRIGDDWFIARSWLTGFNLLSCKRTYDVQPEWNLGRTSAEWVSCLLTKRDRKLLRKADNNGVLQEVWNELNTVRSAQYEAFLEREAIRKEKMKKKLIMEVHRAN